MSLEVFDVAKWTIISHLEIWGFKMPGTLTLNCAGSPAPPVTPISTLQNVTSRKLT
jgi:hypothetical protein